MLSCYRPDVVSAIRVRHPIRARGARDVAHAECPCRRSRHRVRQVAATEGDGSAHWESALHLHGHGRPVHNRIDASFEFRDGSIVRPRRPVQPVALGGDGAGHPGRPAGVAAAGTLLHSPLARPRGSPRTWPQNRTWRSALSSSRVSRYLPEPKFSTTARAGSASC